MGGSVCTVGEAGGWQKGRGCVQASGRQGTGGRAQTAQGVSTGRARVRAVHVGVSQRGNTELCQVPRNHRLKG